MHRPPVVIDGSPNSPAADGPAGTSNSELGTWMVTHDDLREFPRVRALFDHLAEAFRAYQAIICDLKCSRCFSSRVSPIIAARPITASGRFLRSPLWQVSCQSGHSRGDAVWLVANAGARSRSGYLGSVGGRLTVVRAPADSFVGPMRTPRGCGAPSIWSMGRTYSPHRARCGSRLGASGRVRSCGADA